MARAWSNCPLCGQTRNMSLTLPETAILVSSISAAVTGGNVFLTYRTFRRVRPKIKAKIWREAAPPDGDDGWQYILRFINKGLSPVAIERIDLVAHRTRFRWSDFGLIKGVRFERGTSQEPIVISALDGTTYRFTFDMDRHPGRYRSLRFRVLLTNGRTTSTRSVRYKREKWDAEDEDYLVSRMGRR
jgi:hypothetical protein